MPLLQVLIHGFTCLILNQRFNSSWAVMETSGIWSVWQWAPLSTKKKKSVVTLGIERGLFHKRSSSWWLHQFLGNHKIRFQLNSLLLSTWLASTCIHWSMIQPLRIGTNCHYHCLVIHTLTTNVTPLFANGTQCGTLSHICSCKTGYVFLFRSVKDILCGSGNLQSGKLLSRTILLQGREKINECPLVLRATACCSVRLLTGTVLSLSKVSDRNHLKREDFQF